MYVPSWRIGFLIPPAANSASRALHMSAFSEKIKMQCAKASVRA
jgi:hypothetical protein